MALVHLKHSDAPALAAAVGTAESKTSAELVLVVLPRVTEAYPAAFAGAAVAAAATLAALIFGDFDVDEWVGVPATLAAAAAVFFLVWRVVPLRLVTRAQTRRSGIDTAAHAAFSRHGVYRTSKHTGVLLFVACAERDVRVLADSGVVAAVPESVRATWGAWLLAAHTVAQLTAAVEAIGASAAAFLPHSDDDVDELPNAPQLEAAS
ncbi:MAG TPA: hypothetical protein VGO62_18035 [Myxococcota bacterium]|jgi:uncharacterized membrane protein